jgi:hypothetical protein
VTHSYNPPNGTTASYENHPFGVYYFDGQWAIYNDDGADMDADVAFNVLVIKN